jgi:ABC-type multidrug transport system ATPase subunit
VIRFSFPQPPRTGRRVATLLGVHKAYGDNVVYAGVDFEVERGMRVALVGPNGAGKSTCSGCWPAPCRSTGASARSARMSPSTTTRRHSSRP